MNVSSVSNTLNSLVPNLGTVADVLPKNGETSSSSLFAPVEKVSLGAAIAPVATYDKPRIAVAAEVNQQQEPQLKEPKAENDTEQPETLANKEKQEIKQLSEHEQQQLDELKARDREVRTHEQAHQSRGGQHAGSASFTFQTGPDGQRYAVGGEVPVDMSEVNDNPEATLEKMIQVQQAALAPAEPSSQDRQVAAEAGQKAAQAMRELTEEKQAARKEELDDKKQAEQAQKAEQAEEAKKLKEQKAAKAKEEKEEREELEAERREKVKQLNEAILEITSPSSIPIGQFFDHIA